MEKAGQKAILIGAGGAGLKRIGTLARYEMEKTFERKIFLQTFVKVKAELAPGSGVPRRDRLAEHVGTIAVAGLIYMKRLLSLLLAAFFIVPIVAAQPPAQTPPPVKHSDDDRIYDEVRRKLANDVDVKGAGIEVAVKSGAVTLSGKVHTEHGKEKAEKLTKKTRASPAW